MQRRDLLAQLGPQGLGTRLTLGVLLGGFLRPRRLGSRRRLLEGAHALLRGGAGSRVREQRASEGEGGTSRGMTHTAWMAVMPVKVPFVVLLDSWERPRADSWWGGVQRGDWKNQVQWEREA